MSSRTLHTSWRWGSKKPSSSPVAQAASTGGSDGETVSAPVEQNQKYGLFLLNPPRLDSEGRKVTDAYPLDIVAIHGITGDAFDTWTHENGSNWLRDFIPNSLPGARVFSFGYPADVFCTRNVGNFNSFARSLLEELKRERRGLNDQSRRIIFICHSMGGIVIKKALGIACLDATDYGSIRKAFFAILFLSTPHRGSDVTPLPLLLARIGDVARFATTNFSGRMRKDLIKSLSKDSPLLKEISTSVRNQWENIKVASFQEDSIIPPLNTLIVDEHTGVMDLQGERIVPMPGCDHRTICRFQNESSSGYKIVFGVLQDLADDALQKSNELTSEETSCVDSLAFVEMTYRRSEADRAWPNTCSWIFQHQPYDAWMKQPRGLLWIKGKPGAGKSTLLAFIYGAFQKNATTRLDLSLEFFFHGQGSILQKTSVGMFRSLLYQLFHKDSSIRKPILDAFRTKKINGPVGTGSVWQLKELQDLFSNAIVSAATSRSITMFIDALDEAGEEARELVGYFHFLNDRISLEKAALKLCISCRHYPITAQIPGFEVSVDESNLGDIAYYINANLYPIIHKSKDPVDNIAWKELVRDLNVRANGIFHWICLILPQIIDLYNDGDSWHEIHNSIAKVPIELDALYQYVVTNVIKHTHRSKALHLMQWVCLAARPLSLVELRYALACDDDNISPLRQFCKDAPNFVESDARMERLVISLSGGLVEVKHRNFEENVVQFIHQTAYDFMLSYGLEFLIFHGKASVKRPKRDIENEIFGQSHNRLCRSCVNYLRLEEVIQADIREREQFDQWKQKLPFLEYSAATWTWHAERAELRLVTQEKLIQDFDSTSGAFDSWNRIYAIITYDDPGTCHLLHTACASNLQSIVRALLQQGISVELEDSASNRGLHYAATNRHSGMASFLLDSQAALNVENFWGQTPLELAARERHEDVFNLLLAKGARIDYGALVAAAASGTLSMVQNLLSYGVNVNLTARLCNRGTALISAILSKNEALVQFLLKNGADVNLQGGTIGSPLQAACFVDNKNVANLLLKAGADINMQHRCMGNALATAASCGHIDIVEMLLSKRAEVNATGGGSSIHIACAAFDADEDRLTALLNERLNPEEKKCLSELVKLFLRVATEVKTQDRDVGNILRQLVTDSSTESEAVKSVIQNMWSEERTKRAESGFDRTPLYEATSGKYIAIVRLLLDHGADPNIQCDGLGDGTALHCAIVNGEIDIATLLLQHGAAYYPIYEELGLDLHLAASRGERTLAQLLINRYGDSMSQALLNTTTRVVLQHGKQSLVSKPYFQTISSGKVIDKIST